MTQYEHISDQAISVAIEEELLTEGGVPVQLIDIKVERGSVFLRGTVPTLRAKTRAGEVAETIKGVQTVINHLNVEPMQRSDNEVREDIKKALALDPTTHAYSLDVAVRRGTVTLDGLVESRQQRELAEWVVKGVKGIKAIENRIEVNPVAKRPDEDLQAEITRRLDLNVWLDETLIEVQVDQGEVTLAGVVGSASEKTRAHFYAWVDGVVAVNSDALRVEPGKRSEMRRTQQFTPPDDEQIKEAVERVFQYDPRLSSQNIELQVAKGTVVLTGTVDHLIAKQAAEQAAESTRGVRRVKNYLKVRPIDPPNDLEVAQNVREALLWNPEVDRHPIVVACHQGRVYLSGSVPSTYEKSQAESVATRVRGVVEIENTLKVDQTWRWKSDEEIQSDIEERLAWTPFIEPGQITVEVKDGEATLQGTVAVWQQRRALIERALRSGARWVTSHLQIEGS